MAIAALLASMAKTPSASPSSGAASGGSSTASAPTTSPRYNIGSTSNDPRPGTMRPDTLAGERLRPRGPSRRTRRVPDVGIDDASATCSPSRSVIAADGSRRRRWPPRCDTTSRCSSATPPVVLVSARATAPTRSTAPSTELRIRNGSALHASIIRTARPAPSMQLVTTAHRRVESLRLLAASDAPDVRGRDERSRASTRAR